MTAASAGRTAAGKFYITTAIPYVNAAPHIGHALELLQTDVVARFRRLRGEDVFFLTGTDENAQKNALAAEAAGLETIKLVDANTERFVALARALSVSNDDFIRTTDRARHWKGVEALWNTCIRAGDIYKRSYSGLYCVGCEAFWTEKDLTKEGLCPEHLKAPERITEENYFFRLSKYQPDIEEMIEKDELKIVPATRKNEVLSFVRSGLDDFSVSRPTERMKGWGIPVPGDPKQTVYVWFDALGNYITALGYGTHGDGRFRTYWPADLHVIGKGIIRFHAVYWPAMLLSAKVPVPREIFAHGYVTVGGHKMSKSIGNIVDPFALIGRYGTDSVRYFMLREIPPFDDGDYSERLMIERINNELVANVGNFAYRTLSFLDRYFSRIVPEPEDLEPRDEALIARMEECAKRAGDLLSQLKTKDALAEIMALSSEANKYFQETKPWELVKLKDKGRGETVLYVCANVCAGLSVLLFPFLPDGAARLRSQLGLEKPAESWESAAEMRVAAGHRIGKPALLFSKIEVKPDEFQQEERKHESAKKDRGQKGTGKEVTDEMTVEPAQEAEKRIGIDQFREVHLRVATIVSAEPVPGAKKLLKLSIDVGEGAPRTIISGIAEKYAPLDLVGRQIVVIANLKPAVIRGNRSNGMLLAAVGSDGEISLLKPDKKLLPGTAVS